MCFPMNKGHFFAAMTLERSVQNDVPQCTVCQVVGMHFRLGDQICTKIRAF